MAGVTGRIKIGVFYKVGKLNVEVVEAEDLVPANSNDLSNPYVKTYLQPDESKKTKQKTATVKNNLSPEYKETLKYTRTEKEVKSCTLQVSVWNDTKWLRRNRSLGVVEIPLSQHDLKDHTCRWYPLRGLQ